MCAAFTKQINQSEQTSSSTITQDGHEWIQRAGNLWGTYDTFKSYLGFSSAESVVAFAARHNLKRIKHGKLTLLRKDEVDAQTGASQPLSDAI